MKSFFDEHVAEDLKARSAHLRSNPPAQWGRMTAAQAAAHCAIALESASGDNGLPRMMVGRVIGWAVKRMVLGDEKPLSHNSPTAPDLLIRDDRDLAVECDRLAAQIDRVAQAGPAGCSKRAHPFFGRMTPQEWGVLHYKHLDHHLRQFGA